MDPLGCAKIEAVYSYGVCITHLSCVFFTQIPLKNQCDFVRTTEDCSSADGFIPYMKVFACEYQAEEALYFRILIVATVVLFLFLMLGTAADNFFSPSMCALCNFLGMSENLAGVTLLAFGNASPDIFTSLSEAAFLGPEIVTCQLLGGGIFVTSVVAASILLTRSFYANPSAFVRDTLFFMAAISWMRYITHKNFLRTAEAAAMIGLYVVYVAVVAFEAIYQRRQCRQSTKRLSKMINNQRRLSDFDSGRTSKIGIHLNISHMNAVSSATDVSGELSSEFGVPRRRAASRMAPAPGLAVGAERMSVFKTAGLEELVAKEREGHAETVGVTLDGKMVFVKKETLWADFVNEVIPIDDEDWTSSGTVGRVYMLLKAPIIYIYKFIIPVVDQGAVKNGWCKLLNCIHVITAPVFMCVTLQIYNYEAVVAMSVGLSVFVVSIGFAIAVFMTSEVRKPPRYHIVFAVIGFVSSVNMIYFVSRELVSVMSALGYLSNISIAMLSMTFLAYGNSVGDLVSNTALAKAGYPRMAWAGCFGSPLLSSLLGNGMSLTYLIESQGKNHYYHFEPHYSGFITNCFYFLFLGLSSSLLIIPAVGFQCRRSYAFFLIFIYAMFLSYNIMCECKLIHPLGL